MSFTPVTIFPGSEYAIVSMKSCRFYCKYTVIDDICSTYVAGLVIFVFTNVARCNVKDMLVLASFTSIVCHLLLKNNDAQNCCRFLLEVNKISLIAVYDVSTNIKRFVVSLP